MLKQFAGEEVMKLIAQQRLRGEVGEAELNPASAMQKATFQHQSRVACCMFNTTATEFAHQSLSSPDLPAYKNSPESLKRRKPKRQSSSMHARPQRSP
jgi:hypothetical protein